MQYVRIYADQSGESRFEDIEVEFSGIAHTPPAPPVDVADPVSATKYVDMRVPARWVGELHRTPRTQLMFVHSGIVTVQTSKGASRRFAPGDILLLEDTNGRGHRTENDTARAAHLIMMHLA